MKLKLSAFDYPSVKSIGGGESVRIVLTGKVGLRFVSGAEDFAEFDIESADIEKNQVAEHPGEYMKRMLDMQGMVNIPTP